MDWDKKESDVTNKNKRLLQLLIAVELALGLVFIYELYIGSTLPAIGIIITFVACFMAFILAKQGETKLAGNVLLIIVSLMMIIFMWLFDGIKDEALLIFPTIIMFSIYIGSNKLSFIIYFIVCLNILAIGYLNDIGYVTHPNSGSNLQAAIIIIMILSVLAFSVYLISQDLLKANKILSNHKKELEAEVKKRTLELENSLKQLTQTQEQLVESEKMASLGRLVAGVAHEINTPLGIAITATSHLDADAQLFNDLFLTNEIKKSQLEKHIQTSLTSSSLILSNLQRTADLVHNFKKVAVDQTENKKRQFNVKHYLEEILTSLKTKIKNTQITFKLDCPDNLTLYSSPEALAQIITNLFDNALTHAFENQQQGEMAISVRKDNDKIQLIFKDNGIGISEENLAQVFEPFFTTKRGSGGSGLGMHIVYNLVTQSLNGSIKCHSTLGNGTEFMINFPYQQIG